MTTDRTARARVSVGTPARERCFSRRPPGGVRRRDIRTRDGARNGTLAPPHCTRQDTRGLKQVTPQRHTT
jgi:hypothetical protein